MRMHKIIRLLFFHYQGQRDRLIQEEQMFQEERLAAELEKCKLESMRDEKMRQQVRESRSVFNPLTPTL